jgi:hypothetical protein
MALTPLCVDDDIPQAVLDRIASIRGVQGMRLVRVEGAGRARRRATWSCLPPFVGMERFRWATVARWGLLAVFWSLQAGRVALSVEAHLSWLR